jgi:hypothetical protein
MNLLYELSTDSESYWIRYDLCLESNWAEIQELFIPHNLIVRIDGAASVMSNSHTQYGARWSISKVGENFGSIAFASYPRDNYNDTIVSTMGGRVRSVARL